MKLNLERSAGVMGTEMLFQIGHVVEDFGTARARIGAACAVVASVADASDAAAAAGKILTHVEQVVLAAVAAAVRVDAHLFAEVARVQIMLVLLRKLHF